LVNESTDTDTEHDIDTSNNVKKTRSYRIITGVSVKPRQT